MDYKVRLAITKYMNKSQKTIIAVSGGINSLVLIQILGKIIILDNQK